MVLPSASMQLRTACTSEEAVELRPVDREGLQHPSWLGGGQGTHRSQAPAKQCPKLDPQFEPGLLAVPPTLSMHSSVSQKTDALAHWQDMDPGAG